MSKSFSSKGFKFAVVLGGLAFLLSGVNAWMSANANPEPVSASNLATNAPNQESQSAGAEIKESAPLPENLEKLSPGMAEVIKLAQSNISDEVMIAYVEKAGFAFAPTADEILYLKDLGVSDKVITVLLNGGKETKMVTQASPEAQAAEPTNNIETAVETPSAANAPAASVAETAAPTPDATGPVPDSQTETIVAPVPDAPVNITYFQQSLSPYGHWIEVDGYGLCWQPTVMVSDPNWRPYCDRGHWVYSDCGWYWQSDYSWGWAPFHYGRWHQSAHAGWVWIPGYTWGPSWVSWRYTDDYCGWAPLPPSAVLHDGVGFTYFSSNVGIHFDFGLTADCYTFVPTRHFCDPHFHRYRASPIKRSSLFGRSVVENHYSVNKHHVVVNHGIKPSRITASTGRELKPANVKPTPARHPETVPHTVVNSRRPASQFGGKTTPVASAPQRGVNPTEQHHFGTPAPRGETVAHPFSANGTPAVASAPATRPQTFGMPKEPVAPAAPSAPANVLSSRAPAAAPLQQRPVATAPTAPTPTHRVEPKAVTPTWSQSKPAAPAYTPPASSPPSFGRPAQPSQPVYTPRVAVNTPPPAAVSPVPVQREVHTYHAPAPVLRSQPVPASTPKASAGLIQSAPTHQAPATWGAPASQNSGASRPSSSDNSQKWGHKK